MDYSQGEIIEAYTIYRYLYVHGSGLLSEWKEYTNDEKVRGLIEEFAHLDGAAIIVTGEMLYLVPLVTQSNMRLTNEYIKRFHMNTTSSNIELYTMYTCIIIFIGKFYDSYQTTNCTRSFISMEEWLESVNERLEALNVLEKEVLLAKEEELEYNWTKILGFWFALDNLKETAKRQTGNTKSRVSFLNMVRKFLTDQDMLEDFGNDEIGLSEKAQDIVQKYYMEYQYNRGILEFLYRFINREEVN